MDKKFLVTRQKVPYPCVILPHDTVKTFELHEMARILTDVDENEADYKTKRELEAMPEKKEETKISILIKDKDDLICLGSVRPSQVEIFTNIFKEGIIGYYSEEIKLTGKDEVLAVLGTGFY